MRVGVLRGLVILLLAWGGFAGGTAQGGLLGGMVGVGLAALVSLGLWLLERHLRTIPLWSYAYGLGGLALGLLVGAFFNFLAGKFSLPPGIAQGLSLALYVVCAYLGVLVGLWKGPELWEGGKRAWLGEGTVRRHAENP